jgi:hypothetical protein
MPIANLSAQPGCYFSLPRLFWKWSGRSARRSEANAAEANLVGLATFGISYLSLASFLSDDLAWWTQLILFVLLGFATFLFWLVALYVNALIIKLLRRLGLMRAVSDSRAQVVLVALLTTIFALYLIQGDSWVRVIGAIWIFAVVLNLVAAALFAGSRTNDRVA